MTEPREGRGRAIVRDPAEAIAMAKCWLSTWAGRTSTALPSAETFHPRKCGYCEVPRDFLIQSLEEFKTWGQISDPDPGDDERPLRLEMEQWLTLPEYEQKRLVYKAQGFVGAEIVDKVVNDWWNQSDE